MGQPAPQTVSPPLVGGIHRVIRCGEVHICGLCQQGYEDHASARGCLVQCWETQLKLDPVVQRQGPRRRIQFRCRFCARDYGSRERAGQCAAECREHFRTKFELESTLEASPATAPEERRRVRGPSRVTLIRVPVTPRPLKRRPKEAEVAGQSSASKGEAPETKVETPEAKGEATEAKGEATEAKGEATEAEGEATEAKGEATEAKGEATEAKGEATEAKAETPEAKGEATEAKGEATEAKGEATEAKGPRGDPSKPFSRDGAQYVCSHCSAKYFTKDEVMKCFESH